MRRGPVVWAVGEGHPLRRDYGLSAVGDHEPGRKQMPKIYSLAGRTVRARGLKLFFYVFFPASLPFLVTGLKQGWAFAWPSLIAGEMIFVTLGPRCSP